MTANNRSYGWVVVAAGALMTCVALGAMFSLAVFLEPMTKQSGWSRGGISAAMTLDFLVMGVAGFAWGAASDRIGPRVVTLIGAVLLGAGLLAASRAPSLSAFQLSYGVIVGIAAGAFFAPLMAAVTNWFDTRRALAVSLVSAGMGVAPLTMSPFAGWLVTHYDWRTAMGVIGVLTWVLCIPAAMLIRAAPTEAEPAQSNAALVQSAASRVTRALRSPQFIVLGLTFFLCCAAHSGPIFHMLSYAMFCGVPTMTAVSIYSLEGLAGLGGRLVFGVLGDRYGAKRMIVAGLAVQAVAIIAYLGARELRDFYLLSLVFGTAYGGVMPLYAVLARDYFAPQIMGTVLGAATMLSSLGMSLGPVGGGWVFDTFNAYDWMYISSALVGVAAVAIALTFPRAALNQSAAVA